ENLRMIQRVRGSQAHPTSALGAHGPHVSLEPMLASERRAVIVHGHGQEVELNVRIIDARATADETTGLEVVGRAQTLLGENPTGADERLAERRHFRKERDGLLAGHLEIELQVILEVFTHPRQVVHYTDPEVGQLRARTHARELQELRRVDGTATDNHFPPCQGDLVDVTATVTHAGGTPPLEQNSI